MSEPIKATRVTSSYNHTFLVQQGDEGVVAAVTKPDASFYNYHNSKDYFDSPPADGAYGQHALFDAEYHPPKVTDLFATRGGRHLTSTALGLIGNSSSSHQPIEASSNLSNDSERIVDRLADAGVVKKPEFVTHNVLGFKDNKDSVGPEYVASERRRAETLRSYSAADLKYSRRSVTDLPDEAVTEAQKRMRGILRGSRNVSARQFHGVQGEMF